DLFRAVECIAWRSPQSRSIPVSPDPEPGAATVAAPVARPECLVASCLVAGAGSDRSFSKKGPSMGGWPSRMMVDKQTSEARQDMRVNEHGYTASGCELANTTSILCELSHR